MPVLTTGAYPSRRTSTRYAPSSRWSKANAPSSPVVETRIGVVAPSGRTITTAPTAGAWRPYEARPRSWPPNSERPTAAAGEGEGDGEGEGEGDGEADGTVAGGADADSEGEGAGGGGEGAGGASATKTPLTDKPTIAAATNLRVRIPGRL